MPRRSVPGAAYPDDWPAIARSVKDAVGWRCVRCGHEHDPAAGRTLTIHHLNMDPSCSAWWNLLPLCQACHLSVQARVDLSRPWVMIDHSAWFKPYVAGWYAYRYLGRDVSRDEVEADLEWFVGIERRQFAAIAD